MRFLAVLFLLAAFLALPASAEAQECRTRTWTNEAGKTPNGTHAVATDGCHVYEFTTSIGAGPARGETTFMAADLAAGYEAEAYAAKNQCEHAAIAQANLAFIFYFKVPSGTMVHVKYDCE